MLVIQLQSCKESHFLRFSITTTSLPPFPLFNTICSHDFIPLYVHRLHLLLIITLDKQKISYINKVMCHLSLYIQPIPFNIIFPGSSMLQMNILSFIWLDSIHWCTSICIYTLFIYSPRIYKLFPHIGVDPFSALPIPCLHFLLVFCSFQAFTNAVPSTEDILQTYFSSQNLSNLS